MSHREDPSSLRLCATCCVGPAGSWEISDRVCPWPMRGTLGAGVAAAPPPSPHRPLGRPLPAGMRGWSGLYFCKRSSGAGSRSRAFMRRRGDRLASSSASAAKRRKACSLVSRGGRRQKLNWRWASAFSPRLQRSEALRNQRTMSANALRSHLSRSRRRWLGILQSKRLISFCAWALVISSSGISIAFRSRAWDRTFHPHEAGASENSRGGVKV